MNHARLIRSVILAGAILIVGWFFVARRQGLRPEKPTLPDGIPASVVEKLPYSTERPLSLSKESSKKKPLLPDSRKVIPDHVVPFRIEEGLAIAYGDILLGTPPENESGQTGYADAEPPQTWPEGIVPIAFADDFGDSSGVRRVLNGLQAQTKIRFVDYRGEGDGVLFVKAEKHCVSPLGRIGGLQPVRLSSDCGSKQILHEILHTLGFVHEHQRRDREAYLDVVWENIDPAFVDQFTMVPSDWADLAKGLPFDFESILIYSPTAFAKKAGSVTLVSRTSERLIPSVTLSRGDLEKVEQVYGK